VGAVDEFLVIWGIATAGFLTASALFNRQATA